MQRIYLLLTLRGFLKNKVYSFINLAGLIIGFVAFISIQIYVDVEKSYDQFHEKKDRIYRVQQNRYNQGQLRAQTTAANAGVGISLKNSLPEVEKFVRFIRFTPVIRYNDVSFKEDRVAFASEDFFKVFSFPLTAGVDSLVLKGPYHAVFSESAAKRYFHNEEPIGKVISYRGMMDLTVTGVFKDMPQNSHMKLDILVSFDTYFKLKNRVVRSVEENPWHWDGFYTYVVLNEHANYKSVEEKLPSIIEAEAGQWLRETNQQMTLKLQPLQNIHLQSNFSEELEVNGNIKNVLYLQIIAIFIIVIAWINYIGLATAKSVERSKEVGIRKVLGSSRADLMRQFLLESFIVNTLAAMCALLAVYLVLPGFSELTDRVIDWSVWNPKVWWFIPAVSIVGTFASGLYPAFVLSSIQPALILKGKNSGNTKGQLVRKGIVLIPFIIAISLVSCLYVIYKQISFLRQESLGFSIEQKLVVRDSEIYDSLYDSRLASFKSQLVKLPGIEKMTYVNNVPGDPLVSYANAVHRLSADETESNQYKFVFVDDNYVDVFKLSLLAGNNFKTEDQKNKTVIVNAMAARTLGFKNNEDAVNQKIIFRDDTVMIAGVVNDFHHESPKNSIPPVIYVFNPDAGLFFIMPLETKRAKNITQAVQQLFLTTFPNQPFHYFFLDDKYNNQYKSDIQFGKIIGLFSTLLLAVAALGLFGLSAYTAAMRTKEIGVRKVLGASEPQIAALLCKEYMVLIVIATFLAVPGAWYVMNLWLDSFAKKITITPEMFLIPVGFIMVVTLLTISFQTLKATLTNPVETLRDE